MADILGGSGVVFITGDDDATRPHAPAQPYYAPASDRRPYHRRKAEGLTVYRDEDSTVASSLSQQQLLKKRHRHRLTARAEGRTGGGGSETRGQQQQQRSGGGPSRDRTYGSKRAVFIAGGRNGSNSSSSEQAAVGAAAAVGRSARERIRSLVRRDGDVARASAYRPHSEYGVPAAPEHPPRHRAVSAGAEDELGAGGPNGDEAERGFGYDAGRDYASVVEDEAYYASIPAFSAPPLRQREREAPRSRVGIRPPARSGNADVDDRGGGAEHRHGGYGIDPVAASATGFDCDATFGRKQMLVADDVWGSAAAVAGPPPLAPGGPLAPRSGYRERATNPTPPPEILRVGRRTRSPPLSHRRYGNGGDDDDRPRPQLPDEPRHSEPVGEIGAGGGARPSAGNREYESEILRPDGSDAADARRRRRDQYVRGGPDDPRRFEGSHGSGDGGGGFPKEGGGPFPVQSARNRPVPRAEASDAEPPPGQGRDWGRDRDDDARGQASSRYERRRPRGQRGYHDAPAEAGRDGGGLVVGAVGGGGRPRSRRGGNSKTAR